MAEDNIELNQNIPKKADIDFSRLENLVLTENDETYKIERDRFIKERLSFLINNSQIKDLTPFSFPYQGFIHPESEVKPTLTVFEGFKINDDSVYSNLLDSIRAHIRFDTWRNQGIRFINQYAILRTISEYFGNYLADSQTEAQREYFYMKYSTIDSDPISIKDFKKRGISMCVEKAALAQNLLSFLGYDSLYCTGKECELIPGETGLHAFNIITTENGKFIFDPTNPSIEYDSEGNIINYHPASYLLSDEQYDILISGGKIEVVHNDYQNNSDSSRLPMPSIRKYGGLNFPKTT
jgi:hypothetical protein